MSALLSRTTTARPDRTHAALDIRIGLGQDLRERIEHKRVIVDHQDLHGFSLDAVSRPPRPFTASTVAETLTAKHRWRHL
jgi:hypothetical protein